MKEFFLRFLKSLLKAINEIIEEFTGSSPKEKELSSNYQPQKTALTPAAQVQAVKPPINTLVPVEMEIGSDEPPLYQRYKSVLTFQERMLLSAIRKAIKDEYIILMKVRMGDFVHLANEPKDRKFHVNQILCKHVDFLLCGKMRVEPLLVIELDDSSHNSPERMERDKFKNNLFDTSGLPYLRVELQKRYNIDELKNQIKEKILEEAPLFDSNQ